MKLFAKFSTVVLCSTVATLLSGVCCEAIGAAWGAEAAAPSGKTTFPMIADDKKDAGQTTESNAAWKEWHQRIADAADEQYKLTGNRNRERNRPSSEVIVCRFTNQGRILNLEFISEGPIVGNRLRIREIINSLSGSNVLNFPSGSIEKQKEAGFLFLYSPILSISKVMTEGLEDEIENHRMAWYMSLFKREESWHSSHGDEISVENRTASESQPISSPTPGAPADWDTWRHRLGKAIFARYKGNDKTSLGHLISLPAYAVFRVDKDRRITAVRLTQSAPDLAQDSLIIDTIRSFDKSELLTFPAGSKESSKNIGMRFFVSRDREENADAVDGQKRPLKLESSCAWSRGVDREMQLMTERGESLEFIDDEQNKATAANPSADDTVPAKSANQ